MTLGNVVSLWRYPVKSMAGEPLETVEVSWNGLAGDRRHAFVRGGVDHGFPWLTIRQVAALVRYRPYLVDPDSPDKSAVVVRAPSGRELAVGDPELAAELGHDARLIKLDRGTFDAFPLSLITTQTVAALGERVGEELDPRRFRPNLLVEASGSAPFQEDGWIGRVLRIGEMAMRVDRWDGRCTVVNVDPVTAAPHRAVLSTIQRERDSKLGVYGTVVRPGQVAVGDPVAVE